MACVLAQGGVGRGDRAAYLGLNDPNMLVMLSACARLGAVLMPLNYRLSMPELAFIVRDSSPHTLVADAEHRPAIEAMRGELPVRRYIALEAGAAPGWESLLSAESACAATPPPPQAALAQNDVALIHVHLGHHRQTQGRDANARQVLEQQHQRAARARLVQHRRVLQQRWDAGAVLEAIPRHRVTVSTAVPSMLLFLSQHAGFEAADLSSLRCLSVGGSPMPEPLLALYESRDSPVIQRFGMTETTSTVSLLTADRARDKLGGSGTGVLLCVIRLADLEGRTITAPNLKGELCARGGNVMLGYWQRLDATAAAFDGEGWFHTGDVAYMDAEGFLYVCDRLKDMVISGGENVYPAEVESVLFQHPAIAEAAVIGAPDEQWGERVVTVVSLKPGAELTLEALRAFTRTQLAGYKIPRELRIVDALPRTSTGKVQKTALRQA